jgi:hypothetical protein
MILRVMLGVLDAGWMRLEDDGSKWLPAIFHFGANFGRANFIFGGKIYHVPRATMTMNIGAIYPSR